MGIKILNAELSKRAQENKVVYAYPHAIEQICSNDEDEEAEETPPLSAIQQFYEGANVFVTGGTGFIGMALVEKLLRSCPGIKNMFLLIRSRKDKVAEDRAKEMFLNPVFSPLLRNRPNILEKVRIVPGDVEQINLGISAADTEILKKEINVVIHVAATVRFDECLRKAYNINVIGLKTMLDLAESMSNLKAFVHTSTAFCHTHRKSAYVLEKFYPDSPYTESEIEALLSSADDYTITCLQNLVLEKFPNTYTFTKAMAEEIIRQKMKSLPIAVYRPPIVLNSYAEPLRGWSSTLQSAGAIFAGVGLGVLRIAKSETNKRFDVIPVDKCACALIALPWHTHTLRQNQIQHTPIYNHVCDRNPCTWERLLEYELDFLKREKLSSKSQVWSINMSFETNPLLYDIKFFLYHVLPLPLFVLAEKIQKQPPRIAKLYRKIAHIIKQAKGFGERNWIFIDSNVLGLWTSMSDQDRQVFPLDVKDIDWKRYTWSSTTGSLLYILKEPKIRIGHPLKVKVMIMVDDTLQLLGKVFKIFFLYKTGALIYGLIKTYFETQLHRL